MASKVKPEDHTRQDLIRITEEEDVDLEGVHMGHVSKQELADLIYNKRVADERRERYHEDPEFREQVMRNNRRYLERKKEQQKEPVEAFDDLLDVMRAKWAAEEAAGELPDEDEARTEA